MPSGPTSATQTLWNVVKVEDGARGYFWTRVISIFKWHKYKRTNTIKKVKVDTSRQENALVVQTLLDLFTLYRVFLKKVLHKREEKMQEKVKMT